MKDNTILIWQYLRPLLVENTELQAAMNTNSIFPLVAKEGTEYPFIIFSRDNVIPQYTKPLMGGWDNSIVISVRVYSNDYSQSINIANIVRNALEWKQIENQDIKIHPIELQSCYETFNEDGFCQTLTFNVIAEQNYKYIYLLKIYYGNNKIKSKHC